ncbi:hypothetical protein BT93_F2984 [Corymbia citriodora subsp. variegata]|nr:hypothetical protein BT93_F2984 [Corymbia citriodora subsp. variegata]
MPPAGNGSNRPANGGREMQTLLAAFRRLEASQRIMETDLRGTLNLIVERLGLERNPESVEEVVSQLNNARRRRRLVEVAPAIHNLREIDSNWDILCWNHFGKPRGRGRRGSGGNWWKIGGGQWGWNQYGKQRGRGRRGGGGNWWKSEGGQLGRL